MTQDLHAGREECGARRRKRREKMLDAGDIRLLMLHFIGQGAAHGYELIKSVEDLSRGEYTPSAGIVYPNLTLLEDANCISAVDPHASRKTWQLEEAGRRQLAENQPLLRDIVSRLTSLAVLVNNRSIPEVERAIYNFKTALNAQLSQQNLSQEKLHKIIDTLDEAAKKIERGC
ncbi:PadR family transcriptional regulator [Erwinia sp. 9145]|uniref:PadR family transcriptional regulator n=1 Tax=Erwinia sp. 9145 TaxID=1500895 RepID=UPI0005538341|nr:PadR family transcriptional regulator [Erwinia sp. 9145]